MKRPRSNEVPEVCLRLLAAELIPWTHSESFTEAKRLLDDVRQLLEAKLVLDLLPLRPGDHQEGVLLEDHHLDWTQARGCNAVPHVCIMYLYTYRCVYLRFYHI